MKLTEKNLENLNAVVAGKIFLTFDVKQSDMVQISKKWVKFHFSKKDTTALLQFDSVKPCGRTGIETAETKDGKSVMLRPVSVYEAALADKIGRITAALESRDARLVGPFQNVNYELFLPFDEFGNPVREYEIVKVGKKDAFVSKYAGESEDGGVRTRFEEPFAYRAVVLNVGSDAKMDSVSFAYRCADYDVKTTPLYGIEKILGLDGKTLDESADILAESAHSASERRMKLFDAVRHEGAEVKEHGDWIAAVCYKYRQCHVFGRLKPKVIPGTNEIDPECNLEDWEGITPEAKARRDDPHAEWIKDGITDGHGHVFDKLSGESGQPRVSFGCETAWCNCGVLNRDSAWEPRDRSNMYFEYYNNGGKTPYIIFMDKTRGALYEYVKIHRMSGDIVNFLNEDDKVDGGTFGNPPDRDQIAFFTRFCDVHPDFKEFVAQIDAEYFS